MSKQIVNPLRFTAHEYQATTGLYYYRNRWYDPELGRFISEDPIGLAGGINAYVYAINNPAKFRDPTGLLPLVFFCDGSVQTAEDDRASPIQCMIAEFDWDWHSGPPLVDPGHRMPSGGETLGSDDHRGGRTSRPLENVRAWFDCWGTESQNNMREYDDAVEEMFESVAGRAGRALELAFGMRLKAELGTRGLAGSRLITTGTPEAISRWVLNRSWRFSTPTMIQGVSVGSRYVGGYALAGIVGTNALAALAIHGAWRGGIAIGSGIVGAGRCF